MPENKNTIKLIKEAKKILKEKNMEGFTTTFRIKLGSEVKSNISDFKGIVTCAASHLNGCDRYFVNPKIGKDGKLPDGYWFDDGELIVLKAPVLERKNIQNGGFPSQLK